MHLKDLQIVDLVLNILKYQKMVEDLFHILDIYILNVVNFRNKEEYMHDKMYAYILLWYMDRQDNHCIANIVKVDLPRLKKNIKIPLRRQENYEIE